MSNRSLASVLSLLAGRLHGALLLSAVVAAFGCGGGGGGSRSAASTLACQTTGPCDQAESERYGLCLFDACDTQYKACLGPDYRTAHYGGPCGATYNCFARCSCGDNACYGRCGGATVECQLCLANMVGYCQQSATCPKPACVSGIDAGALKTCADLATCCAAMIDPDLKMVCQFEYNSSKAYGSIVCSSFVQAFESAGYCP